VNEWKGRHGMPKVDGDLDQKEGGHEDEEPFFGPGLQWFPISRHALNLCENKEF
jgi:hypothetical protein